MVNVTRRVVPATVATAVAAVVADAPAAPGAGCSVTVTFAGWMVPDGNPDPVTLIDWMPGCPAAGDADDESVTAVSATTRPLAAAMMARTTATPMKRVSTRIAFCGTAEKWQRERKHIGGNLSAALVGARAEGSQRRGGFSAVRAAGGSDNAKQRPTDIVDLAARCLASQRQDVVPVGEVIGSNGRRKQVARR